MIIGDFRRASVPKLLLLLSLLSVPHLLFSRPLTAKKKTLIVALGDSTTAGTPFFRSPLEAFPDGAGDPEGQYGYWIMRKKPQWDVRNFGVAGQTSSDIRARFEQALALGPRYLVILAGVNDIYQGASVSRVSENLLWMYSQAKSRSIMPVAVTVLPFDSATPEQAAAIEKLNQWIIKQSEAMRIPLADANAAVRDPKDHSKLNGSPDGLHPDVGGYRMVGLKVIEAIEPIEKAWR